MSAAPASYALGIASQDVPQSWLPSTEPRIVSGGSHRIVSISSQNGTVSAGQIINFQLPAGPNSGFLVSGSAYIRGTVSVTQANAYSWAFKQLGAASSIFQQMGALLSGTNVDPIQNYNKVYNALLNHATNANFIASDSRMEEGTLSGDFYNVQTFDFCVPVAIGSFNAKQHLPLFMLSSAQLQCLLESTVGALVQGSADALTNYTVSNATLVFEQLVPDMAYEMGIRQMMAQKTYSIPINTWYVSRTQQQPSITHNLGLNTSSLKAVLWQSVPLVGARNSSHPTNGGQTSAQLTVDGALVCQSRLASMPEQYLEMNRCLNSLYDITRTSIAPETYTAGNAVAGDITLSAMSRADYTDGAFLGGISCSRSNQQGFAFSGSPCRTATLAWTGTGAVGDFYIYCALEQLLVIDAVGSVNLIH